MKTFLHLPHQLDAVKTRACSSCGEPANQTGHGTIDGKLKCRECYEELKFGVIRNSPVSTTPPPPTSGLCVRQRIKIKS